MEIQSKQNPPSRKKTAAKGYEGFKKSVILHYGWLFVAMWTAAMVLMAGWNIFTVYKNTLNAACIQADGSFEKDLVYRRWVASHGGVYVPSTDKTPPNPYLSHIKNRDITTTSGRELTLMNPAYMTRQVQELGRKQYGHQGHITSLNPLRPENIPDAWEAEALRAFEHGETKVAELAKIDNTDYLRLMRPMITESRCMKCHEKQGYKVGDLRGGISVSVPMAPLWTPMYHHMTLVGIGYALIWLLGLGGIGFAVMRINRHITDRILVEAQFKGLFDTMPSGVAIYEATEDGNDFVFKHFNRAAEGIEDIKRQDLIGRKVTEIFPGIKASGLLDVFKQVWETGHHEEYPVVEYKDERISGWRENRVFKLPSGDIVAVYKDLTIQKNAEAEKVRLEAQLQQAQKMESVGRLAGGIAHDYNNALSVIIGFTEMAIEDVDPEGPLRANLDEVFKAAKRAADITRQLLAFARKQIIAPIVLDLNENVESTLKMLRRLIGEDIDLVWLPGKNLWPVKMDPTQIDQILANLCVNARDAIDGVGKVTIETENTSFDEDYCADHPGFVPGDFVLLAVSDNGCGMDKEILDKIFEPFFTTKDVDKGTGLGLAMLYGIVKQNNGFINVYSEPDKGTTIKIYLSRHKGKATDTQEESPAEIPPGQGETLLLVEDDLPVLKLGKKILDGLGYTVLTAGTPEKAIGLAKEHAGEIHLLVTDVIMPEMNGRELAQRLQLIYPDIKHMFMSGYTANAIAHHGVLDKGVHFIQKPFSRRDLAVTVRKALDSDVRWISEA